MVSEFDLSDCNLDNFLWTDLSKILGYEKASQAINQALDLQNMTGSKETLPILFMDTCGIALFTISALRHQTGLTIFGTDKVLIFSRRKKSFQIICKKKL